MRVHRNNVIGCLHFVLFIILLLFHACAGESDTGSTSSTGSITFSIRLHSPTIEGMDRHATAINCAATGISTVEGEVFDENNSSIATGGPWACSDGSGVISNVTAGSNRRVVIRGRDSSGNTLFEGEATGINVVTGGSSNAGTIDLYPQEINTVSVGIDPIVVTFTPDGNFAYVTHLNTNTVSVIRTSDNTVIGTPIGVGDTPIGVDVTPNGSFAYVANSGSNTVSVIQTSNNTVIGTPIGVGDTPNYLVVTPDGSRVYVANSGSDNVSVIETSNNMVLVTIPVGTTPRGVAVTPDGSHVYVTNSGSDNVSVIETSSNAVVSTVPVGDAPVGISMAHAGNYVYITNVFDNTVSVIQTSNKAVIGFPISVGNEPYSVAVSPLGNYVYVVNRADDTMSVIQTSNYTEQYSISVGDTPQYVAVKSNGGQIYVANTFDNEVSVIAGLETDDNYEENDTLATAYDLGSRELTWLSNIDGLGFQADEDWYKIDVTPNYQKVQIDCQFTHADGDIDIELYDSSGNWLTSSDSATDNESIDYTVSSGGTYYIRVYYGNQGNTYDLWWDDLQVLFYDGFEDGDFSDWNIGSGTYTREVTSSASASGTSSFTLTGGSSSYYDGVYKTLSNLDPTYISFYAMSSSTSTSDTYFVIGDDDISSNDGIIFFFFWNTGELGVYDGSQWISGGTYTANTWYHMEFKNIDWSNKKYDFYVNGVLASSDVDFRSSSTTSITQLHLYNYHNSQAWWDEIEMY